VLHANNSRLRNLDTLSIHLYKSTTSDTANIFLTTTTTTMPVMPGQHVLFTIAMVCLAVASLSVRATSVVHSQHAADSAAATATVTGTVGELLRQQNATRLRLFDLFRMSASYAYKEADDKLFKNLYIPRPVGEDRNNADAFELVGHYTASKGMARALCLKRRIVDEYFCAYRGAGAFDKTLFASGGVKRLFGNFKQVLEEDPVALPGVEGAQVHGGMLKYAKALFATKSAHGRTDQTMHELLSGALKAGSKVYYVGFSMGGALASVQHALLRAETSNVHDSNTRVFLFGALRAGNKAFVQALGDHVHNYVSCTDRKERTFDAVSFFPHSFAAYPTSGLCDANSCFSVAGDNAAMARITASVKPSGFSLLKNALSFWKKDTMFSNFRTLHTGPAYAKQMRTSQCRSSYSAPNYDDSVRHQK
jgi:Lipase (class 3)